MGHTTASDVSAMSSAKEATPLCDTGGCPYR